MKPFRYFWSSRLFGVPYHPRPEERGFLRRLTVQEERDLAVELVVLDDRESERFFGVPLARRGIQPIWLKIRNQGQHTFRLRLATLDPSYFPPLEAAYLNHFAIGQRLLGFGLVAWWFFLPLLLLLPFKVVAAWFANRAINAHFQNSALPLGLIRPGQDAEGFVFVTHDQGTKLVVVRLQSNQEVRDFSFAVPVPGLRVDHGHREFSHLFPETKQIECDEAQLKTILEQLPRCTTDHRGHREGDPLNLMVVGEFNTVLQGFGPRWDETETISLQSCLRTARAFLLGAPYLYSPVSPLYVDGRSQDFALQKARETINQRLHLRLWITPYRFKGQPVWIGQVSRDIGVRFTLRTWNLTTHKIDPDVDDARDYVLDDTLESGRVSLVGYVGGIGEASHLSPRHNLTGDPYFTDGYRLFLVFSAGRTQPIFLTWT